MPQLLGWWPNCWVDDPTVGLMTIRNTFGEVKQLGVFVKTPLEVKSGSWIHKPPWCVGNWPCFIHSKTCYEAVGCPLVSKTTIFPWYKTTPPSLTYERYSLVVSWQLTPTKWPEEFGGWWICRLKKQHLPSLKLAAKACPWNPWMASEDETNLLSGWQNCC